MSDESESPSGLGQLTRFSSPHCSNYKTEIVIIMALQEIFEH